MSGVLDSQWQAQQFTTDGTDYNLVGITLLMLRDTGTEDAIVEVWSNTLDGFDDDVPGVSLHTLTPPGTYSSALAATAFTTTGFTLSANSTYWVVLRSPSASTDFGFSWTLDASGDGDGFSPEWRETLNSGSSWSGGAGEPYQMQVEATPVPEPASIAILSALGLLGFGVWRRRAVF